MLNQSADYALRAVLYVAQHGERRACSAETISGALGVPRNYIGKVLNTLARTRVLKAVRGPRGGFRLGDTADRITLASVIEPFQRLSERRICLLGDRPCDAAQPCGVHRRWQQMADPVGAFFRDTTVAVMLSPPGCADPQPGSPGSLVLFAPEAAVASAGRPDPHQRSTP